MMHDISKVRRFEKVGMPEVVQEPLGPAPAVISYCWLTEVVLEKMPLNGCQFEM